MFRNVLIVVDASKASSRAARHGLQLAKTLCAKITLLTVTIPSARQCMHEFASVIPEVVMPQTGYADKHKSVAMQLLQNVAADARRARLELKSVHRSHRDPSERSWIRRRRRAAILSSWRRTAFRTSAATSLAARPCG